MAQQHPIVLAKAAIIVLVLKKASLISLKTKIFVLRGGCVCYNARHHSWHPCQKSTNPHYHTCPVSALMHWL